MADDLISRQAVLDELNKWEWQELYLPIHFKENIIDVVPSVNPQEPMSILEDIKAEIKEWYWQADKQAIAKDPCVVVAMIDLFIRTIDAHISGEPQESENK